jgi:predicted nucleic acid-binding protein
LITLDTSGVVALFVRADENHARAVAAFAADRGPYLFPIAILSEAAYLLESRHPLIFMRTLLGDLEDRSYTPYCGEQDFARIAELADRYADLPLGVADAAVIACAERHGGRVLTFDLRHFGVVAREGRIEVVP